MRNLLFIFILLIQGSLVMANDKAALPASDTLHLTLQEAERLFQERNIPLLAQKASIESAKAAIIQARLFENPTIYVEQNAYNPNSGKRGERYFDMSRNGETIVSLQQLVYLAGKRNKRVNVEQLNTRITEFEYFDLLRTLRYSLRTSFLQLYYQLQAYQNLHQRTLGVQQLVTALEGQYQKGNVPLKEVTRLKAFLFTLENQKLNIMADIQQQQADLRLLTQTPATQFIAPVADEKSLEAANAGNLNYNQLLQIAQENRYDLKAAETNVSLQQANLTYQKSLAVPDVTIGGLYDRAGNFIQNYTALTVQMPIPLLNRNQGNIKIAKNEVERSRLLLNHQQQTMENEVMAAYQRALDADRVYSGFDHNFTNDFNRLIDGVTSSFARRNISLIEFLDYYETYTETIGQQLELRSNRLRTLEEINYTVGKPVITY